MDPNSSKTNVGAILIFIVVVVTVLFIVTRTFAQNVSFGNQLEKVYK